MGRDISEVEVEQSERAEYSRYLVQECGLSPSTAWTYEQHLLRLERFAGKAASQLTVDDIRRFLRTTDYHPSTKNGALVAIKSHHKWGAIDGRWELNGITALRAVRQVRDPKPSLTPDEAVTLLEACRRPNEFRLIYLGLYAGLRVSDSARIGEKEWLPDRLRFHVTKNRKLLEIPVHPELVKVRSVVLQNGASRGTLKHVARSLSFYTGIHFTSHTLRRTYATTLIDTGAQEGVVEALLGHTPKSVLRGHYAPVTFKEKTVAMGPLTYRPVAGED